MIDFEGKMNNVPFEGGTGKGHHLSLGSQSFIPGFEEGLVGKAVGSETKLNLSFPKDYGMEKLSGKKVTFDVKIHEIREASEVAIDNDFAKSLGMPSLKDLKKAISDQISNEHLLASRSKMKKSLLDILDEKHNFELPEGMLEQEYNSVCTSLNKDSASSEGLHDHDHKHNNLSLIHI